LVPNGERLLLPRVLDSADSLGLHFNPLHTVLNHLKATE
jgi:hypothetical protein